MPERRRFSAAASTPFCVIPRERRWADIDLYVVPQWISGTADSTGSHQSSPTVTSRRPLPPTMKLRILSNISPIDGVWMSHPAPSVQMSITRRYDWYFIIGEAVKMQYFPAPTCTASASWRPFRRSLQYISSMFWTIVVSFRRPPVSFLTSAGRWLDAMWDSPMTTRIVWSGKKSLIEAILRAIILSL